MPNKRRPLSRCHQGTLRISGYSAHLSDSKDQQLVRDLGEVGRIAATTASKRGIFRNRPNEAGNDIERFVKDAMKQIGYSAQTPRTPSGAAKAMGYPDIYFKDRFGRHVYLECKTYNKETIATTQRSFYFSLARKDEAKITHDARHIVLSFQIEQAERQGRRCYLPIAWKVVSIDSMEVSVKHEFNASNEDIYRKKAILTEGEIS